MPSKKVKDSRRVTPEETVRYNITFTVMDGRWSRES